MNKPTLTPYSGHDNAGLVLVLEATAREFVEHQTTMQEAQAQLDAAEPTCLVQYADIPTPLSDLRTKLSLLEAEMADLKKAIAEGERGLRTTLPDVMDTLEASTKIAKELQEQMGLVLAEMSHRGIRAEDNRDVVLGQTFIGDKAFTMVAREIRNAQSWNFDALKLMASLPPERLGFFTFDAKPGHGDVSKKMANEWLRRVIAEGNAPDGVAFAPMVLAKVGGDDPVYLVEVTTEGGMSDANAQLDAE